MLSPRDPDLLFSTEYVSVCLAPQKFLENHLSLVPESAKPTEVNAVYRVKVLPIDHDDLSLIPGSHMVEGSCTHRYNSSKLPSDFHMCAQWHESSFCVK